MTSEPPKPMTQLAEPVAQSIDPCDVSAPRRVNSLGEGSARMSLWAFGLSAFLTLIAGLARLVSDALSVVFLLPAILGALGAGLGGAALYHASRRHLKMGEAVAAIVLGVIPILLFLRYALVVWLTARP